MKITLAYGTTGLELSLPDDADVTVVEPTFVPAVRDPVRALREALRDPFGCPPLRELVRPEDTVAIVFSDITRAAPNHLLIPAVLDEVTHVPLENIVLCNALGTHRPNTEAELMRMLGTGIVHRYRIEQNNAFDPATQVCLGRTSWGHELWLNRTYTEARVKVLTGFIEPHFFAGFSGGGKAVMPGMAGQRTVLGNHDARMIEHPQATWGITRGNPIWEEIHEAALQAGPAFLLNVTLNRDQRITGIFAGDMRVAHEAGTRFVRDSAMIGVDGPFDIVITTNSGYPLDQNLYQAVKGMSAAAQIVRPGGAIIAAAACSDGLPDHGLYGELLRGAASPAALLETIRAYDEPRQDQWQAQIQALIQLKAEVYVYSDGLSDRQIEEALVRPCRDIPATVEKLRGRYGRGARIAVLPEGPQTVPYLSG